jgi:hypothetical protein
LYVELDDRIQWTVEPDPEDKKDSRFVEIRTRAAYALPPAAPQNPFGCDPSKKVPRTPKKAVDARISAVIRTDLFDFDESREAKDLVYEYDIYVDGVLKYDPKIIVRR